MKNLPVETQISMLKARIGILTTRGEIMNHGIINKLKRKIRALGGNPD